VAIERLYNALKVALPAIELLKAAGKIWDILCFYYIF
jgi:hypothetical protein